MAIASYSPQSLQAPSSSAVFTDTFHGRHNNYGNLAFFDGHAESVQVQIRPPTTFSGGTTGIAEYTRSPDMMLIQGAPRIEYLGKGAKVLSTPDVPRALNIARFAAESLGHDITDFEAWRVRLEFPIDQSNSRIYCL